MVFTKFRAQVAPGVVEEGTIIDGVKTSTVRSTRRRRGTGPSATQIAARKRREAETRRILLEQQRRKEAAAEKARQKVERQKQIRKSSIKTKRKDVLAIRRREGFFVLKAPKKKSRSEKIILEQMKLRTKVERGIKLTPKEEAQIAGLTVAKSFIEASEGVVALGKGALSLIKNPKNIKKVPKKTKDLLKAGKSGAEEFGRTARVSPTETIAIVGTEILIFKGAGRALKLVGKLSSKATTQLIKTTPKFAKVQGGRIIVKSQQTGKKIVLDIVESPVKKIGIPLKEQVKLAGRRTTVVSAQADKLVNLVRTKRVIRKPIPNESLLKLQTRNLLKKFDEGKITKKEIIILDRRIRLETKGAGSILERSFFASPKGKLRISRLGREPADATLLDILAGDVTFRTLKPQILIFEKAKVQKFPKALKNIENKLKAGKTLTRNEANKLLQFQLKKSSKFKPIGSLSKEPEVTLSPNEIVRKVKTIAFTEIRGKRIPIIRTEVVKAKPETARLLKKSRQGKITTNELKKLRSNLKKETGFKTSVSRRTTRPKPRARIPKTIPRGRPRPRQRGPKGRFVPRGRPRPTPRPRPRGRPIPRPRPRGRPTPRPRPRGRPVPRGARAKPIARVPPRKPIIPIKFKRKRRGLKKKPTPKKAFNVFARPLKKRKGQKRPKLVKVNVRPLSKQRAKDLRNFITDTSLSRTARIKPTTGKPKQPRLKVPKSFSKKSSKKFRRHRTSKGKRIPLPKGKVIEKRRHLLDTKQEKKQITLRRRIKQITKKVKRGKR